MAFWRMLIFYRLHTYITLDNKKKEANGLIPDLVSLYNLFIYIPLAKRLVQNVHILSTSNFQICVLNFERNIYFSIYSMQENMNIWKNNIC